MTHEADPTPILELAERVAAQGVDAVREALGRYVLVGESLAEEPESWMFATSSMVSPSIAGELGVGFDFERGVVHALVKRTATFPNVILIGRSSSNDVRMDHPSVSKLHARARLSDDGFELEDAGSRNGTWVDRTRLARPTRVGPGDRLRFGQLAFTVHDAAALVRVLERIGPA